MFAKWKRFSDRCTLAAPRQKCIHESRPGCIYWPTSTICGPQMFSLDDNLFSDRTTKVQSAEQNARRDL